MKLVGLPTPQTAFDVALMSLLQQPVGLAGPQRPTQGLVVGESWFDTSLGKPVWWSGTQWVDATGVAV